MARLDPVEALAAELGAPVAGVVGRKISPMLCALDDAGGSVLASHGHVFELKLDGVRIVADRRGGEVTLSYRRQRDATRSYPEVARALAELGGPPVVLDGEIVAFDEEGLPDFQRLGTRIHVDATASRRATAHVPVAYLVFDVLAVGARDVRGLPIEARRRLLERIVTNEGSVVRLPPVFDDGTALFRMCLERGLEGVVAKRRGSTYREGERTSDWVKVKNLRERDFVVVGWTPGEGRRARLGALDLAAWQGGELVACGSVGSGLDEDTIDLLLARLAPLETDRPTARGDRTPARGRRHVRPELVVSVRYMGTSTAGKLRAPVFRGLRADVAVEEVAESPPVEVTGPDVLAQAAERWRDVPLVGFRIAAVRSSTEAVVSQAIALRELTRDAGLPALALATRPGAVDVVVPIGAAPEGAANALALLLARLASGAEARGHVLQRVPRPWAAIDRARVSVPLDWSELGDVVPRGVDRAEAVTRLVRGEELAGVLREGPPGGLASVVLRLEAAIARWAGRGGPR